MLHLHSVSKSYGTKVLFSDVSFTVGEKEKVGVMGRNGYGKSTFFRLITGEELPDDGQIEVPYRYIVRKLEQHLVFRHHTLEEQVASRLPLHEKESRWKARSILMGLGFSESDFSKCPTQFSSGFQVRIRLAEALVSESDLLLLDEPTNYLDIVSLRWLKNFLKTWTRSFLLITHDINFMKDVCSHSAIIHRGKIRKMKGSPQKLLDQIEKDEQVYERTRVMEEKKQQKTEAFIKNFRAGARSAGLVQSRIKMLDKKEKKIKLDRLPEIRFSFPSLPFSGDHLLRTHNLSFGYDQSELLIEKVNIEINGGNKIAIIGPNGKGKSTLLKLMAERLSPVSGHLKKYHILTQGYFGQEEENHEWNEETVLSELFSVPKVSETEARRVAGSLLFSGGDVKKKMKSLSGGEKARVRLGKLMLQKHHLLLLDEPSNHLDIESVQKLIHGLESFEGALVIISHDERLLSCLADTLIVFDQNEVSLFYGTYQEFLEQRGWSTEHNEALSETNEKQEKESVSSLAFSEKKRIKKEIQKLEKEYAKLEQKKEKLHKEMEKKSFALNKALRSSQSPQVVQIGKEIKEIENDIITTERNQELNIEATLEREMILEQG